jgi:hypothetical protein
MFNGPDDVFVERERADREGLGTGVRGRKEPVLQIIGCMDAGQRSALCGR